jgi:hypothetical protein
MAVSRLSSQLDFHQNDRELIAKSRVRFLLSLIKCAEDSGRYQEK